MGKVYHNKLEIPIPSGMYINKSDRRVFRIIRELDGSTRRVVYGYAMSENTMHVNDMFKSTYPDLWEQHYGKSELRLHNLHCGMYALVLGIIYKTELYAALQNSFGPETSNAILDYCIFSLLSRLDVTHEYQDFMLDQVLFSSRLHTDSWYSTLFSQTISPEQIYEFRLNWINNCKKRSITKVWLCVDGSNNNCQATRSDLAQFGKAKSDKHIEIVSYIYAISAEDGLPIAWFVNEGNMVDSKAFQELWTFVRDNLEAEVLGAIIDRGFCTMDVIDLMRESNMGYILMLPSDNHGHRQMQAEYSETIRWKSKYMVSPCGVFGIADRKRLFRNYDSDTYVNLYFDGVNGSERSAALMGRINSVVNEIKPRLENGDDVHIPRDFKRYLSIRDTDNGKEIVCNYENWDSDMSCKGYYSIASSDNFGPVEVDRLYRLRDASETQFMIMKSMEGFDVTRVHSTRGIQAKLAICFISSIIRNEILKTSRQMNMDVNKAVSEINRIKLQLRNDDRYYAIMNHSMRQKEILSRFGIKPKDFETIASSVSAQLSSPVKGVIHKMPEDIRPATPRRGRPRIEKESVEKRKPGRPKGSVNSKTLKKPEVLKGISTEPPKRGKGRPKGSLGKKTLEFLAKHPEMKDMPKRGKGRPPGSRNKKTLERLSKDPDYLTRPKRGRGRPAGSLNKSTIARLELEQADEQTHKRGRGRPPGSLNKKTLRRMSRISAYQKKALADNVE